MPKVSYNNLTVYSLYPNDKKYACRVFVLFYMSRGCSKGFE